MDHNARTIDPDRPTEAPDEVLAELFPLGGPYTPEGAYAAAYLAAELIRYLNHATLDASDRVFKYPSHAAHVLEQLATAMHRLPQLLHQTSARLGAIAQDPKFYVWDGGSGREADPAQAVRIMQSLLLELSGEEPSIANGLRPRLGHVGTVATELATVGSRINRMGIDDDEVQS